MPMINEAIFAVMEGVGTSEAIDTVMKLGMNHPMGPLALADLIGLDVCLAILNVLHEGLGDPKYRPCPLLRRMVAAGQLGAKSGQGFYHTSSQIRGASPPRTPFAVARGAPRSPLRSGGRARGAPDVFYVSASSRGVQTGAPPATPQTKCSTIGPMMAISHAAALRLIAMEAALKRCRRSVPGNRFHPEMNQRWLNGHSAWIPNGHDGSAPSQSSRRCEACAAAHISTRPHAMSARAEGVVVSRPARIVPRPGSGLP